MVVEQFLPALHDGDAIGNSTLCFHRYLQNRGIESRIVAMTVDPVLEDVAVPFEEYKHMPASIKILHFAVPSALTDFFLHTTGKKVMIYHNITPPAFFSDFSDELTRFTAEGRRHLESLRDCFDLCVADSRFNADELSTLDFPRTTVFPIMIDLAAYDQPYSRGFHDQFHDGRRNLIFVGRVSPNKRIEDLVKTVFFYKKYISPSVRLIVAGKTNSCPRYFLAVRDLASRFHLTSEDIVFTGHVPFEELLAVYRLGDVFLSMSEHEGFCLPLIESCHFAVPVIAHAAGAVPETLDGAGLLVSGKRYDLTAALIERVVEDADLHTMLKRKAADRMTRYRKEARPAELLNRLDCL